MMTGSESGDISLLGMSPRLRQAAGHTDTLAHDASHAAMIRAVIGLAEALNLKLIAERVETAGQLTFLRWHGGDEIHDSISAPGAWGQAGRFHARASSCAAYFAS